jgi:ribosome biogenesis GTPase A
MYKKQIPSKNIPKKIGSTDITPYWRVIENIIKESDILLEVIDIRMPELSRNKKIEDLVSESKKELIIIGNKSDIVSKKNLNEKIKKIKEEFPIFIVSSKNQTGIKKLRDYLYIKESDLEDKKIGILGYPNTGKSSLINALVRKNKAKVTSKAGTTHGPQWIKFSKNFKIIDSPGVIPLNKEDELRYILIGSKNVEKIKNLELVAHKIIDLFNDKSNLEKTYEIKINSENPDEIIEQIGKKKGFLKSKGDINESRTSILIIKDWQKGKLRL